MSIFDALTNAFQQQRQANSVSGTVAPYLGGPQSAPQPQSTGGFLDALLGLANGQQPVAPAAPVTASPLAPPSLGQGSPLSSLVPPGPMPNPGAGASGINTTKTLPGIPANAMSFTSTGPAPITPRAPQSPQGPLPAFAPAPAGPLPSVAAAQGVPQNGGLQGLFASAQQTYGLPAGYLPRLAAIESSMNPNAVSPTGAAGPFQFTKGTAAQYGLNDPTSWADSTDAAARLTAANAATLTQGLGRAPTPGELYLAHQQGPAGALKLLANPNARAGDVVGDKAVRVNGGDPNATAGQFANMWTSKFGDPGPVAQSTVAAGFDTPFNGASIGPNPNGFSGGTPSAPLPAMAAMGTGMVPNASGFSQQAAAAPQPSSAPVSYAGQSAAGTAAGRAIAGGMPLRQPYGSVPLNVGGQMLTRQQAENTDGYDHTDYDAAAVNAGLIPSLAAAPAFSDGSGQPVVTSSSRAPGSALALSPAIPRMPPPAPPTSSNAAFTITPAMIGALVKNPDTQAFGLQLWQHMLTTKSQPQIAHAGDVILDANGRPLYQIPNAPQLTDAIKNYNFAQQGGYAGSFTDYQSDQQKADKAQLADVPLANGQFQKVWITPGQNPAQGTPVGAAYTRQPANQVNIDQKAESASEQGYGKAVGDDLADTVKAAGSAPVAPGQIAMMRGALAHSNGNITTGPFAQIALKAKQAIGGTFGITMDGVPEAEVINNIGYGLATQAARAISNRPTQFEFGQALATKPGLALSPQGMQAILNIKEQDLHDQQNLAVLAQDPANRQNWTRVKQAYYAAHPIMSPFDPLQPLGQTDMQALNAAAPQDASGGQSITAQDAAALPVVSSPAEAAKLRPGAMFRTPEGRVLRR